MMSSLVESVARSFVRGLYLESKKDGVEYAKIKATKAYIQFFEKGRNLVIFIVTLSALLTVAAAGWGITLLGLGIVLNLSSAQLGIFLLSSGLLTFAVPAGLFVWFNREANWLEASGAKSIIDEIVVNEHQTHITKH